MSLRAPRLTRRQAMLGGLCLAGAGVAVDGFLVEPRCIEVTRHRVVVQGLAAALEGFTLVQITDAHLRGADAAAAIATVVLAERPSLVALTGDLVESESALPYLAALGAALGAARVPTVGVYGNWEHWGQIAHERLRRTYASFGGLLLGDEARRVAGIVFLGTDDAFAGSPRLGRLQDAARGPGARVLLTHSPCLLDLAAGELARVDLALAGHTHGGQARLGGFAPLCPPGSGRFVAGFYETPCGPAYVGRGLGTSVVPARVLCRPEVPVFRFARA